MQVVPILKYGVVISFFISVISLSVLVLRTFSFGKRQLFAHPKGDIKKGIRYAFGKGMMPWEKESAKNHLATYFGGILYHIGIFVAVLYLFAAVVSVTLPSPVLIFSRVLLLVSFISGASLLLKRIILPHMRTLSCPDDFVANIIVDIFILFTFIHTFYWEITPFLFLAAIIMFLYMPLGKIRHCFFFFYVRVLFGIFYGRRNILPPTPKIP